MKDDVQNHVDLMVDAIMSDPELVRHTITLILLGIVDRYGYPELMGLLGDLHKELRKSLERTSQ